MKLQASATLKDAKVKTAYNTNQLLVTFEMDLKRPDPIPDRKHWEKLPAWQNGPKSNDQDEEDDEEQDP